jgi:hypothetical protein
VHMILLVVGVKIFQNSGKTTPVECFQLSSWCPNLIVSFVVDSSTCRAGWLLLYLLNTIVVIHLKAIIRVTVLRYY